MRRTRKILPYYTYEEYCQWEGRWELIEGIPYAMSPAPTPRHQKICANIITGLTNAIKKTGCKNCSVYNFIDIKISEDTIVQPDVLVVCKEITKSFLDFPAALVVEILSPSTTLKDRNSKYYLYEHYQIPYYIMVDTDKNELEIYHLNEKGKYELEVSRLHTFQFDADCKVEINFNSVWE